MIPRKAFLAAFRGWCPICHARIEVGDVVVVDDGKNVVHWSCAEDDDE